jgi:copper(I)-binding protein
MKQALTFERKSLILGCALAALGSLASHAVAQTSVKDAWVRATVFQQKTTGAFMEITSAPGARLLAVATPLAQRTEIHEMKMDGDIMRMAAVPGVDLPAGVMVPFKSGGFHIMMMGLKAPLQPGTVVPLTLTLRGPSGKFETVEVQAPVRPLGLAAPPPHKMGQADKP